MNYIFKCIGLLCVGAMTAGTAAADAIGGTFVGGTFVDGTTALVSGGPIDWLVNCQRTDYFFSIFLIA